MSRHAGEPGMVKKILKRTFLMFIIGVALHAWDMLINGDGADIPSKLRVWGVLQRIALSYCFASLFFNLFKGKYLWHAIISLLVIYAIMGAHVEVTAEVRPVAYFKVVPYLLVLVTAICGLNVMAVLVLGTILCGAIGMLDGSYDLFGWLGAMGQGVVGMGELIIVAMLAGGMLELIRENGGIDYIIERLTAHINGKRGAELAIAGLVSLVNVCTANNTIAILTVGQIAKKIGDRYGGDNKKAASLLDTFSCCIQGILPYGVQILLAAGLAHLNPIQILPFLFYPFAIGIAALLAILLRYPKRYS
jgi:Na+/H+ antiporter NhaC